MIGTYNGRFRLNVRKGAGTSFPVVRTMEPGEGVAVLSIEGDWARVQDGFVMADKLDIEPVAEPDGGEDFIFEKMRVVELKDYAFDHGIELTPGMKRLTLSRRFVRLSHGQSRLLGGAESQTLRAS